MEQWLTQVQIVVYFGVEAQITNIRQSQKGELSWGTQEEFLPEQGNGSVSLPPIVSNTWQQVNLQIQHKITLQKQLKRCFRCLAREGADNWRNFQLLWVEDLEQKIRFVFSGTKNLYGSLTRQKNTLNTEESKNSWYVPRDRSEFFGTELQKNF